MEPQTNLDTHQIRNHLRDLSTTILGLKKQLRRPWGTEPMGDEQRQLLTLKAEATELCILRAFSRGKFHLRDHEQCELTAARLAPLYRKPPAVAA